MKKKKLEKKYKQLKKDYKDNHEAWQEWNDEISNMEDAWKATAYYFGRRLVYAKFSKAWSEIEKNGEVDDRHL